jgi:hypothetical protein
MVQRNVTQGQKPEREGPYTRLNAYVAIAGVIIAYLTLAYTVHWPPFSPATPNPRPPIPGSSPTPYPTDVQQAWLSACEQRNNTSVSLCQCELTYFEQHASLQVFEQDYGQVQPGTIPPHYADVVNVCGTLYLYMSCLLTDWNVPRAARHGVPTRRLRRSLAAGLYLLRLPLLRPATVSVYDEGQAGNGGGIQVTSVLPLTCTIVGAGRPSRSCG